MFSKFLNRWKYRLRANGPRVLYSKAFVLPSIYRRPAIPVEAESAREVHALVSRKDFDMLMWAAYSFYSHTDARFSLVVHDDGTLTAPHHQALARLFPGARLIPREESDQEMGRALASYPRCAQLRRRTPLALKVFDFFHYARGESLLLLDSDVLFFRPPVELTCTGEGPKENVFNADPWSSYVLPLPELRELLKTPLPARVNIGLGVVWREVYRPETVEDALAHEAVMTAPFLVAQTLVTLMASALPTRLLGPDYAVTLEPGTDGLTSKHYIRLVRHLFFSEGIPLVRRGLSR
jgi:hypothetical protein